MAFIDSISWQPASNDIFAAKHKEENLSTLTQLVVAESQEAVLFSKGRIVGKFGPGKHTLNTENLPLLRTFFGIPFGGNNPFRAEVWFVNKITQLTIDWGTGPMRFHDPDYQEMVPIVCSGRYGLQVIDAERFLVKLVGALPQFGSQELTNHFLGALVSKTKSVVLSYMQTNNIGIKSVSGHLEQLSAFLRQSMVEFWEDFGFNLVGFYVTSIDVDGDSPDGARILDAMSKRSAQNIAGYSWQQDRVLDVASGALSSAGDGGGLLGALLLSGIGAAGMGQAILQPPSLPSVAHVPPGHPPNTMPRKEVFCARCTKKYPTTSAFCPHCGKQYRPCAKCTTDNDDKAKRCVTCGTQLVAGMACGKCQTPIPPGAGFCSSCGSAAATSSPACQRCGTSLDPAVKFCPACGTKAVRT